MSWEETIRNKGNNVVWKKAWRKAQKIRNNVEKISDHFFEELVTVGIDVFEPPDLGKYTPHWEPLADSWAERKGSESCYYDRGDLERLLLRKSTQSTFGRPQVFLEFAGRIVKVNADEAAKKYAAYKLTGMKIRVVPFPKLTGGTTPEELVAGNNSLAYYKLMSMGSPFARPLVTPFVSWYIHVKIRRAMKGVT